MCECAYTHLVIAFVELGFVDGGEGSMTDGVLFDQVLWVDQNVSSLRQEQLHE